MDTTETELQTLRREIDVLCNENIALYNELVKQNKILFEQVISIGKELANQNELVYQAISFFNGQNLNNHLISLAGKQTAEFIIENMNKIRTFSSKKRLFAIRTHP